VVTNLPAPGADHAKDSALAPADLAEIVRLFELRVWVEQSYKQVKYALGWGEYQVRSDRAIRPHWILVWCAFSFCRLHQCDSAPPSADPAQPVESGLDAPPPPALASGGKNQPATIQPIAPAQRLMASGPADRARLAGTLADALALLEGVVAATPATVAPNAA